MTTIQLKRKIPFSTYNETLLEGEPLYDLVSKNLYVGNGALTLSSLPFVGNYSSNASNVADSIKNVALTSIFENNFLQAKNVVMATKIGSVSVGNNTTPTYINLGDFNLSTKYAGATKVTLNGLQVGGQDASIFAPTSGGAVGQILVSQGTSSMPIWKNVSQINVGSADEASEDSLGNPIASTYCATIGGSFNQSTEVLQLNLYKQDTTLLSSVSIPIYLPTFLGVEIDDTDYGATEVVSSVWYPDNPSRPWAGGRLELSTVGLEDPQLSIAYSILCQR